MLPSSVRPAFRIWMLVPAVALGLILVMALLRVQQNDALSALGTGEPPPVDAGSPTGRKGGVRYLLRPGAAESSFEWIVQTQLMLAEEGRLRETTYDNAPTGRPVIRPSPYRWWLGAMAWIDHTLTGRPIVLAVEYSARWADAALHGVAVLLLAALAWRAGGGAAAAWVAWGAAVFFPVAGRFVAGQPDGFGLVVLAASGSLLALLIPDTSVEHRGRRWFFGAGLAGGLAGWLWPSALVGVIGGVVIGILAAQWAQRQAPGSRRLEGGSWRWWAIGGSVMWLIAWAVEAWPDRITAFALHGVHPWQLVAWWGAAGLLARTGARRDGGPARRPWLPRLMAGAAGLAVVLGLYRVVAQAATGGMESQRVSNLPGATAAANTGQWLAHSGISWPVVAAVLPLVVVLGALVWAALRTATEERRPILLVTAFLVWATVLALWELWAWSLVGAGVLAALAWLPRVTPIVSGRRQAWAAGLLVLVLSPGLVALWPRTSGAPADGVDQAELLALVERDLAHGLAQRIGEGTGVVLAPPNLSLSLHYYGGLQVLGTPHRGNDAGFAGAVRIAGATSPDEAQALAEGRQVRYFVLPSWDPFLEEYARLSGNELEKTLVGLLQQWMPPRWLRPLAYPLPTVAGFEGQSVALFELVEVQEQTTALGRLGDFFLDQGALEPAAAIAEALLQLAPDDPETWLTRAQTAPARGGADDFAASLQRLLPMIEREETRYLPWDRRVSLAVVLMQARRVNLARAQVERLWEDVDEEQLRSLSTAALVRLMMLSHALQLPLPQPRLEAVAMELLPREMREQMTAR